MQPTSAAIITKGKNSVLPNSRSVILICCILGSQMLNHMAFLNESKGVDTIDATCLAKHGSVFPFCMGSAMHPLWIAEESQANKELTQEAEPSNLRPLILPDDS